MRRQIEVLWCGKPRHVSALCKSARGFFGGKALVPAAALRLSGTPATRLRLNGFFVGSTAKQIELHHQHTATSRTLNPCRLAQSTGSGECRATGQRGMSIHVSGGGNGHSKSRASTPQNVEQRGNVEVLGAAAAMAAAVASSNYLVLFPFNDWFTAGTLTYPITFLLTDITNRKFGKEAADKVVLAGFIVAMPMSMYLSGPRIAIASGTAYLTAQLLDVRIFDALRHRAWWVAPLVSTTIASAVDSSLFVTIAFLGVPVPWVTWGIGDFVVKVLMALAALLPFRALTRHLASPHRLLQAASPLLPRPTSAASAAAVAAAAAATAAGELRAYTSSWAVSLGGGLEITVDVTSGYTTGPGLEITVDVTSGVRMARLPPDAHTPSPTPPPAPSLPASHPAASDPHRGGEGTQPSAAAAAAPGEGGGGGGGGRAEYVPEVIVDDFDYELPAERIAVRPCEPRDASRLLVYTPGNEGGDLNPPTRLLETPPTRLLGGDMTLTQAVANGPRVVANEAWAVRDHLFRDASVIVPPHALLVLNNSKVVAARLGAYKKETRGAAEVMLISPETPSADPAVALRAASGETVWAALIRGRNIKEGDVLVCQTVGTAAAAAAVEGAGLREGATLRGIELVAEVTSKNGADASVRLSWTSHGRACADLRLAEVLEEVGRIPLPPYLKREDDARDLASYQTPHASIDGSVAAPTAGLHFSREVVSEMRARGVEECQLTLHVGAGTFRPVSAADAAEHSMHAEWMSVSAEALQQVRAAVGAHRAIVPVGTTSVRTLESLYWWGVMLLARDESVKDASEILVNQWDPYRMARQFGGWDGLPSVAEALDAVIWWAQARAAEGGGGAGRAGVVGRTHLLIVPGYRFALCDLLFTNTHQPRSTLVMLVSALVGGHARIQALYQHALQSGYRFLSYGDSCLLACHARNALRRLPHAPHSGSHLHPLNLASTSSASSLTLLPPDPSAVSPSPRAPHT